MFEKCRHIHGPLVTYLCISPGIPVCPIGLIFCVFPFRPAAFGVTIARRFGLIDRSGIECKELN